MPNHPYRLESGNFSQDWSDFSQLATNDWSHVAGITGYRGATLIDRANFDARLVTGFSADDYLRITHSSPDAYDLAGVVAFAGLANPTVAIGGAASTRAPSLVLDLDATGRENIVLSFTARDLEAGSQDAVQQLNVQYRVGNGPWINVPGGYIADATVGNATMETRVTLNLPSAAAGHADLQVRIMTTDASGYDEWIGIDDISVTSTRNPSYVPPKLDIGTIQGAAHTSPYDGALVTTNGIVTAVDARGYYIQSATADGDAATSDAIYVLRSGTQRVAVGDAIRVTGVVHEVGDGSELTSTQITAERVVMGSHGNALPAAVLIGEGGILPPTSVVDDDGMTSFDPAHDGIDFWESLEGMRVTLVRPQAVSNTDSYGQTYLVASDGDYATGMSGRGGINIGSGDWNPEVIQLDDKFAVQPGLTIGDQLGDLTGILGYSAGHFELLATVTATVTHDATLVRETTAIAGDANHMTVVTYNVANLDPTDGAARFARVANDIANTLHNPDVIALQKVQDADGTGTGSDLSGAATAQLLIDAIFAQTGVLYTYVEVAPTSANTTAGELNGNIRNGYLYRADRVSLVDVHQMDDPVFEGTRRPLVATWEFNGHEVTTVNVHFTSLYGSDDTWGSIQPAYQAGTLMRTAQIAAVRSYVAGLLGADPDANVMVAGDFNGFMWESAQRQLTNGGLFTDLATRLAASDRYSSIVDGNGMLTDHILVSGALAGRTNFDIVHINSEFAGSPRGSDHDPLVASIFLDRAPTNLHIAGGAVAEGLPAGTIVGRIVVDDTAGETFAYELLNAAGGRFVIDPETGIVTTTRAFDFEGASNWTIRAQVTDSTGLSTAATLTISILDVNEAPVAGADAVSVLEDATSANLWATLLANDRDPDSGAVLRITAVDLSGTLGSVTFDPVTGTLRYSADHDSFDRLGGGQTTTDSFTYTVTDQYGLSHQAVVTMTVRGIADGAFILGGNGKDYLVGTEGEDRIFGYNSEDVLIGLGGHDWLEGGRGPDTLTGGEGHDSFAFGLGAGWDFITDYTAGEDRIVLIGGSEILWHKTGDFNGDGIRDTRIAFADGLGGVTLLGVSDWSQVQVDHADGPTLQGGLWDSLF